MKPPKMTPNSLKSKLNQKPQFPSTLLANFWYLTITKLVSNGKWPYLGLAPLWKTFWFLERSELLSEFISKVFFSTQVHSLPRRPNHEIGQTHFGNYLREFTLTEFWQKFCGINSFTKLVKLSWFDEIFFGESKSFIFPHWTIFCTSNKSCLTKEKFVHYFFHWGLGNESIVAKITKD